MSTKEEREAQADVRKAESAFRMRDSENRQRKADEQVYGEGSALLEGKSSSGGDHGRCPSVD